MAEEEGLCYNENMRAKLNEENNGSALGKQEAAGKPVSRISVRTLVEFLLRSGDIDTSGMRGTDVEAALLGARIHRKIQKSRRGPYQSEVPLRYAREYDDLTVYVEGRADGVLREPGADVLVEEIKGMYLDVTLLEAPFAVHLAQAKCYGAMLLLEAAEDSSAQPTCGQACEENAGGETSDDSPAQPKCGQVCETDAGEAAPDGGSAQPKCGQACEENAGGETSDGVTVQMTYVNLESEVQQIFAEHFTADALAEWFFALLDAWHRWAAMDLRHTRERDASMRALDFPFPYREGQQKLTAAVYHTIREGAQLFLMAPTGVGKTMSCVFPAVRAVGEGHGDKIFYLTAKNETLAAGREAFSILLERGLKYRVVRITAKEKICPLREPSCNPRDCTLAKGHFDRVGDAVFDSLRDAVLYDRETILSISRERQVCPFELTLDLASWCDAVLADYNYVFDPDASLKRFFSEGAKGKYIFLIDEAHNLVDRGREMYSAVLVKEHVLRARKAAGKERGALNKAFDSLNRQLLKLKKRCAGEADECALGLPAVHVNGEERDKMAILALRLFAELQAYFTEGASPQEELLDFFFELRTFLSVSGQLDENYVTYAEIGEDGELAVHYACVTPAGRLSEQLRRGRSAVFFSATLLPVEYFKRLLTTEEKPYAIYAPSPFDPARRLLLIARDVNSAYRRRGEALYRRIAEYILIAAKARTGNYMVFFPSYRMLQDVFQVYVREFDCPEVDWVVQGSGMQESDREIFLENFYEDPERSLVGFCVLGGSFSEGLDLAGTRLIGALVIGAGIPQVSNFRELLKKKYDEESGSGFDYAYRYPGMNKVEQAAGRVIRTESDRGVILLLDDRLLSGAYTRLFPREWRDYESCTLEDAGARLRDFWNQPEGRGKS